MKSTPLLFLLVAVFILHVDSATTFQPIRITLDTDALSDGQDVSASCRVGQEVEMTCSQVGETICTPTTPNYVCTENDIINATTRKAALDALTLAISTVSFLQVNPLASSYLWVNSSVCLKDTSATPNVDHIVVVTMRPADSIGQGSATPCLSSTVDSRPIVSNINLPPATTANTAILQANALRFLLQALGFDYTVVDGYVAQYDTTDGTPPKTYYQYDPTTYPNGPLSLVGPTGVPDSNTPNVPAGTIVQDTSIIDIKGMVRMMMHTPNVLSVARSHFGCNSLTGVLLEEQSPSAMRWERRQINFEVLGSEFSVPTDAPILSSLTVAAFMDMGFYRVDATLAAKVTQVLGWGFGMGCAFAQGCTSSTWPDIFCYSGAAIGYDRTFWGTCAVVSYETALAPAYQHFSDTKQGGADPIADYCPYLAEYSDTITNPVTVCTTAVTLADNVGVLDSSASCGSCRAVHSNLVNDSYVAAGNTTTGSPRCMDLFCINTTHVAVRVGQRYMTCKTGDRTALTFPLSHPSYAPPAGKAGTTYWTDYVYNGVWDCPQPSYVCQTALGGNAPYRSSSGITLTSSAWPEIVELDPPHGVVTGAEAITVSGRNLFQKDGTMLPISCRGLWIGGVATVFETYTSLGTNATTGLDVFVVNTSALPQAYNDGSSGSGSGSGVTSYVGGEGDDGSGTVDVALLCKIPDVLVCSGEVDGGFSDGYCALSTKKGAFTYTSIPPTPPGTYFLSDSTNQIIIIAVFAVVMLAILTLIYFYCRSTYAPPDAITLAKLQDDDISDNEMSTSDLNMKLLADMAQAAQEDEIL